MVRLDQVCQVAARPAPALTGRDVARVLLTEPATEARADLPELRREMFAAGNPLSAAFWDATDDVLARIDEGAATVGDVNAWIAATGTEPVDLLDQMFVWPEQDEAGPVARELHALLVSHLETLVADGLVDPDLLVIGDPAALAAHRQHQTQWLDAPLPDGRIPRMAIQGEADDAFLAAWDDAEQDARTILRSLLDRAGDRPLPAPELAAAAARLREDLPRDRRGAELLRRASGVDPRSLPSDDVELWLTLASGVVAQREEPPRDEYDEDTLAAWSALQHADWIAMAVTLARGGPGLLVEADQLARQVIDFDFEEFEESGEFEDEAYEMWGADGRDATLSVSIGLVPVLRLWRQLGALDDDDRLTELGWWGIPASVDRAWQGAVSDGP